MTRPPLLAAPLLALLATHAPAQEPASRPVLRIDGEPVSAAEFENWLVRLRAETLAHAFVQQRLVRREAAALGVDDVADRVKEIVEGEIQLRVDKVYRGDRSKWVEELAAAQRTPEGRITERTIAVENEELLRAVAAHDRVIPREKLEREWNHRYGKKGRNFDVLLLFKRLTVPSVPGATAQERREQQERLKEELRAEMTKLRDRVHAGESFSELVAVHSEDAETRARGGATAAGLDTVLWPDAVLDELAKLPPGEVSEPHFVRGGYWLVQMRKLTVTPLEQVEDELRRVLIERGPESDETSAVLNRLWEGVEFEVLPAAYLRPEAEAVGRPADEPVLRIGAETVPRAELARWLARTQGELVARRFAEDRVLARVGAKQGLAFSDEDVLRRVDADIDAMVEYYFKGDREKWSRQVLGRGRTLETYRRDMSFKTRGDMIAEHMVKKDRVITDDAVRAAWTEKHGEGGVSLDLRMIVIEPTPPDTPLETPPEEKERLIEEAIAAARAQAEDVVERIEDGEDFASLARKFSSDPGSRDNGGKPAAGFKYGSLGPDVVRAIEALKPGGVTAPVQVGFSFFVFELIGRVVVPFDDVRDALREELKERRPTGLETSAYRNVLMREVLVEVLPGLFE